MLLRAEFEKVLAERIGLIESRIASEVNRWVRSLLDDPHSFSADHLDKYLRSLSGEVAAKYPIDQIPVSVLQTFFDSYVYRDPATQEARPVSAEQAVAFQKFKGRIMERAVGEFQLSLLLRDFLIHRVSADRRLSFYAEAAEKLLEAFQANDITVVSTPTGSGKSTLMPLLILASGLGYQRIAVTQPRRYDSAKPLPARRAWASVQVCGSEHPADNLLPPRRSDFGISYGGKISQRFCSYRFHHGRAASNDAK
jgi:hypothetical protein